ncbi:hypothetical protein QT223_24590, partial [Escherichia coli]|nr:hypothetical protein [Escherichia coli]
MCRRDSKYIYIAIDSPEIFLLVCSLIRI